MSIQTAEYHKAWRARNKDKIHGYYLKDYAKRKDAIRLKRTAPSYRKKLSAYLKDWRKTHTEKVKLAVKDWASKNKERIAEYRKAYAARRRFLYELRKAEICKRKRELAKTPKYRARSRAYSRRRRATSIQYALKDRLRATMGRALRRQFVKKSFRTMEIIGCSPKELRDYLEGLFKPGMTWANRNLWHVDHKRPLASFDLRDLGQQKLAFHYSNLQPLWKWENQQKSDKLIGI